MTGSPENLFGPDLTISVSRLRGTITAQAPRQRRILHISVLQTPQASRRTATTFTEACGTPTPTRLILFRQHGTRPLSAMRQPFRWLFTAMPKRLSFTSTMCLSAMPSQRSIQPQAAIPIRHGKKPQLPRLARQRRDL